MPAHFSDLLQDVQFSRCMIVLGSTQTLKLVLDNVGFWCIALDHHVFGS
jgi:hypothetical protein